MAREKPGAEAGRTNDVDRLRYLGELGTEDMKKVKHKRQDMPPSHLRWDCLCTWIYFWSPGGYNNGQEKKSTRQYDQSTSFSSHIWSGVDRRLDTYDRWKVNHGGLSVCRSVVRLAS